MANKLLVIIGVVAVALIIFYFASKPANSSNTLNNQQFQPPALNQSINSTSASLPTTTIHKAPIIDITKAYVDYYFTSQGFAGSQTQLTSYQAVNASIITNATGLSFNYTLANGGGGACVLSSVTAQTHGFVFTGSSPGLPVALASSSQQITLYFKNPNYNYTGSLSMTLNVDC